MKGRFIIKRGGTYILHTDYYEIPADFDELIEFCPEVPDPPHTPEEHAEMARHAALLKNLLERNHDARRN